MHSLIIQFFSILLLVDIKDNYVGGKENLGRWDSNTRLCGGTLFQGGSCVAGRPDAKSILHQKPFSNAESLQLLRFSGVVS